MINDKLLESLIGLARAVQGNEDLITEKTYSLILTALKTNDITLIPKLEEEKMRLVPDCYTCKVNCGRNANYDINDLYNSNEVIEIKKLQVISKLITTAKTITLDDKNKLTLICTGLFSIGLDYFDYDTLLEKL